MSRRRRGGTSSSEWLQSTSESQRIHVTNAPDESGRFAKPIEDRRAGVRRKALQNFPKKLELDLHGYDALEAGWALAEFVYNCTQKRDYCILVIVGRGLHSKNGVPVLKDFVRKKLVEMQRDEKIVSFSITNSGGAFWVFLPDSLRKCKGKKS